MSVKNNLANTNTHIFLKLNTVYYMQGHRMFG